MDAVVNVATNLPMRVVVSDNADLIVNLLAEDGWLVQDQDAEGIEYAHACGARIKLAMEG